MLFRFHVKKAKLTFDCCEQQHSIFSNKIKKKSTGTQMVNVIIVVNEYDRVFFLIEQLPYPNNKIAIHEEVDQKVLYSSKVSLVEWKVKDLGSCSGSVQ
ncbi:hypothetical protein M0804_004827 [Polistes exclamans]|nr:hypothetical protein M0804_004827 [Polistes exclamans]